MTKKEERRRTQNPCANDAQETCKRGMLDRLASIMAPKCRSSVDKSHTERARCVGDQIEINTSPEFYVFLSESPRYLR